MTRKSEDLAAIRKLAEEWSSGWDRGDTETLLSLYASDPVLMPQGQPVVTGRGAIRSLYESFFKNFTVKGEGKVVEVEVSGDLGYLWSSYTLTATPRAGGERIKAEGKAVFIVRRQKGNSWKITRLIDNSDEEESTST